MTEINKFGYSCFVRNFPIERESVLSLKTSDWYEGMNPQASDNINYWVRTLVLCSNSEPSEPWWLPNGVFCASLPAQQVFCISITHGSNSNKVFNCLSVGASPMAMVLKKFQQGVCPWSVTQMIKLLWACVQPLPKWVLFLISFYDKIWKAEDQLSKQIRLWIYWTPTPTDNSPHCGLELLTFLTTSRIATHCLCSRTTSYNTYQPNPESIFVNVSVRYLKTEARPHLTRDLARSHSIETVNLWAEKGMWMPRSDAWHWQYKHQQIPANTFKDRSKCAQSRSVAEVLRGYVIDIQPCCIVRQLGTNLTNLSSLTSCAKI